MDEIVVNRDWISSFIIRGTRYSRHKFASYGSVYQPDNIARAFCCATTSADFASCSEPISSPCHPSPWQEFLLLHLLHDGFPCVLPCRCVPSFCVIVCKWLDPLYLADEKSLNGTSPSIHGRAETLAFLTTKPDVIQQVLQHDNNLEHAPDGPFLLIIDPGFGVDRDTFTDNIETLSSKPKPKLDADTNYHVRKRRFFAILLQTKGYCKLCWKIWMLMMAMQWKQWQSTTRRHCRFAKQPVAAHC